MTNSITDLGLVEVAAAIHRREISSVECTRACLEQIERCQSSTNAFIRLDGDLALEAAEIADRALARQRTVGSLHGVPLAHKDLLYRAGRVSTGGSKILRNHRPNVTATALERLDKAGAIDLGTLNMSEFAAGGTGHNEHYGDCHNPWDIERAPGGSSSGSGAAVAARMVYAALGSDTGGSVRLPAALCGVCGLKPSDGRVSRYGVMPRSWTSDTLGPLARHVSDIARLLRVIAGHDPRDPTTSHEPVPDYEKELDAPVSGLRIGVDESSWQHALAPDVATALDDARRCFTQFGCLDVALELPDLTNAFDLAEIIVKCEAASLHERWLRERPDEYSIAIRTPIEAGLFIPAAHYLHAQRMRGRTLQAFLDAVFSKCDALLMPAVSAPAPRLSECDPNSTRGATQTMSQFPRFTRPISYLGLPALVLLGGFNTNGLPIAFQLIAPPFAESLLLSLGNRFQQATDWHLRKPRLCTPS